MVAVLGEQIGPKRYNHGRRKRDFLRSARRWRETFRPPRETERHSTGGLNAARHRELSQGLPQGFRPSRLAGRTPQGGPMHTVSRNAIPALTTEQMRAVDRAMVEDLHIELVQMMENAGRTLADILTRMGVTIASRPSTADLVIDALIGYSLRGDPAGPAAELISWANDNAAPVLALDTPSGLDLTTGAAGTPAVWATVTLTLALPKVGLLDAPSAGEL